MNPIEMAEDFGMAIMNSKEFQDLNKAQENLDDDVEAQKLIQEYQEKQMEAYQRRQNGMEIPQEKLDAIKNLQAQMMENNIIKEYLGAKQRHEKFMAVINRALVQTVGLTLGEPGGASGCDDCSSCC